MLHMPSETSISKERETWKFQLRFFFDSLETEIISTLSMSLAKWFLVLIFSDKKVRFLARTPTHQGYWGAQPSMGAPSNRRGAKSWKIFEHFFGNFLWNLLIKMPWKSDFWGCIGRYISKISKITLFWDKNTSTKSQKFGDNFQIL